MSDDEGAPPAAAELPSVVRPRVQFTLPEAQADDEALLGDDDFDVADPDPGYGDPYGAYGDGADMQGAVAAAAAAADDDDDVDDADDDVAYLDRINPEFLRDEVDVSDGSGSDGDDDVVVEGEAHRKPRLPVARIRRIMVEGTAAPSVAADAARRAALSTEDFIADFVVEAANLATRRHGGPGATVTYAHLVEVAQTVERFAFLADALLPEKRALPKGQRTLAATLGAGTH